MKTPIYVGVDGGGTGCRVRIEDTSGRRLGEAEGGSANIFSDFDGAVSRMIGVVEAALAKASLDADSLARCHVGLGLAGADIPDVAARFAKAELPFARAVLVSDVITACLGAHAGADGGLAVVGTGTAYVARIAGRATIFGGWGPAVSDLGSGADLGRRVLSVALLAHDGLVPHSDLTREIMAKFEGDPAAIAHFASRATPGEFGRFAPILFDHADAGDAHACEIRRLCVAFVERALRRLVALEAPVITLVGGLAPRYTPLLDPALRAVIRPPIADALEGALMLVRPGAQ